MGCPSLPAAAAAIAAAAAEATAGDSPRETEDANRRRIITDCGGARQTEDHSNETVKLAANPIIARVVPASAVSTGAFW